MAADKKIVLICFSFPPFPGIGGRRWAKFAKYLAQNNFDIHVIAAENKSILTSEWTGDVQNNNNIKLHFIPLGLFSVLSFVPETLIQKIKYRILKMVIPIFINGNLQDKSIFIRKKLLIAAENIIKNNNIKTVIVTIPPYNLAYYLLPLKNKFNDVKFIVDYRDPWTDNKSYHGFAEISKKRFTEELRQEKEVLNGFDVVLDVNTGSLTKLKQNCRTNAQFFHLPNGFDASDYNLLKPVEKENKECLRFIYTGSFYPNLLHLLRPIVEALNELKLNCPIEYKNLKLDFYGNMDHEALSLLNATECEIISFKGSISKSETLKQLNSSDYFLLFAAPDHSDAFNTKLYEYLNLRKPIIYFGNAGKVSEFILQNKIGFVFEPGQLAKNFLTFLTSKKGYEFRANQNVNMNEFDIKNITQKLIEIINA